MIIQKLLTKPYEIRLTLCSIILCLTSAFLFYVYVGLPRKIVSSQYELINSQSNLDKEEYTSGAISLLGWFVVSDQDSSHQLKKEIVLSNDNSNFSYPVQYINRPEIADVFKNGKYNMSGFFLQINTRFIKKGTYKLYIKYIYDNKKFISDLKREIVIR